MNELEQTVPEPEEQYSKTGLVVFGILQIIFGAVCLLVVTGMTAAQFAPAPNPNSQAAQMELSTMLPGLAIYLVAAVWFIWIGIGSVKARRWARDLTVIVSWVWLLTGIGSLLAMFYFVPDMSGTMPNGEEITPQAAAMMKNVMIGIVVLSMIVVPAVLLAYYSTNHVKQTVLHRDPVERWTGRAPLPVMILAVFCLWGVVSLLNMGMVGWILPFFGTVLKGALGASLALLSSVFTLYAAWNLYKLNSVGWWIVVVLFAFWTMSMIATVAQIGLAEYYAMFNVPGVPAEMVAKVNESVSSHETMISIQFCIASAIFLGFLIYTKKYFTTNG